MSVPLSLTPLDTSTDPVVVRRLPFVFAKRHGVLLQVWCANKVGNKKPL